MSATATALGLSPAACWMKGPVQSGDATARVAAAIAIAESRSEYLPHMWIREPEGVMYNLRSSPVWSRATGRACKTRPTRGPISISMHQDRLRHQRRARTREPDEVDARPGPRAAGGRTVPGARVAPGLEEAVLHGPHAPAAHVVDLDLHQARLGDRERERRAGDEWIRARGGELEPQQRRVLPGAGECAGVEQHRDPGSSRREVGSAVPVQVR